MNKIYLMLLALAVLLAAGCSVKKSAALPSELPLEDFFRNPEQAMFRLSPDGTRLAYLAPYENRLNVFVKKIGEDKAVRLSEAKERDIMAFFWKGNERIVYIQDFGGDENFHLYGVDLATAKTTDLTPFPGVKARIIDPLLDVDGALLIGLNKRDARIFDVYRLDLATAELKLTAENPGNVEGWLADNQGRLRLAETTDGLSSTILYRESEDSPWRAVKTTNFKDTFSALAFTYDDKRLYVLSNLGRDKTALYEYDPDTDALSLPLYENAEVDVSDIVRSRARKQLIGATYDSDRLHVHYFDAYAAQIAKDIDAKLGGMDWILASRSRDEEKLVLRAFSDVNPGASYLYDVKTKKISKLADFAPWLSSKALSPMRYVSYAARDGRTIHAYLTLPKNAGNGPLPTVVLPHGGPWARDNWGYSSEVQFLANRGFAVFQPNFRGSTGYGRDFWTAGFKQWGLTMQDDITDGVKWLVETQVADPRKIAISGASYGGYAVLAGLAFTPELYACGVDYVGVSNIFDLLATMPAYWELSRKQFEEMVGDPVKDAELLRRISPVFHVDKIKVPVFVAQGANDPRVKRQLSDQMVEALRGRGIPVEYMVKDNEGHGFHNVENRLDFYRTQEKFLKNCLGMQESK